MGRRGFLFLVPMLVASATAFGEFRTWTAAAGGFTTEAEFIELKGSTVRLRLKDGTALDLGIEKLSAADQKYAREQVNKGAPSNPFAVGSKASTSSSSKNESLAKLEADVARCQTAEEALRLYRIYRDDPGTSEAQRKAIEPKLTELRELAEKKMVRMQGKWVTEEEFRKVRNQANSLMKQGLELLRLKQEDGFRKKFAEAAALEPDSVRADFTIGLIYSLVSVDQTKTKQYFENCLKRDPSNVCVLNNLALASVKRGDFGTAVANWRKAVELGPSQHLVQNLGRFIDQAGQQKIKPAKGQLENITDVYTTLTSSGKFERANLKRGWMWMVLDEDLLSLDDKKEQAEEKVSVVPAPGEDGSVVVGGGTGFMIFPDYILTNNHVVDGGTSFEIQTHDGSKDKTLKATLVATSKKPDLALLRCEGLSAQHLAIDPAPLGRGTDIMTLGYPEMFILGASLKATRGVISAVPSSSVDDMYLYDAVVNHGNSGGPVFDSRGNVVAVTTIMVRTEGKYGGGIPGAVALEFVKKHVPNYAPPELKTAVLDWPAVDKVASPATVLVWKRSKTPGSNSQLAGADYYEDRDCMLCNGGALMECPIKGCNKGVVVVRSQKGPCPVCKGKGKVLCPACKATGKDPDLVPPKVVSNTPTTPSTPPSTPSTGGSSGSTRFSGGSNNHPPINPVTANAVTQAINSNGLVDTPIVGGGDAVSRKRNSGAILLGVEAGVDTSNGVPMVGYLRPIYLSATGVANGSDRGIRPPTAIKRLEARPGYAVGGLRVNAGARINSMVVVFMRVIGDRLDPNDRYESELIGGTGGQQSLLAMDGSLIVGLITRTAGTSPRLDGLGLLTVPRRN
jgi:S1-C subfamily serine protease